MIRQRHPIQRHTSVRKFRAKPRRGPERDQEYKDWLKTRLCVVCAKVPRTVYGADVRDWRHMVIDPAHTKNNGMCSKGPDSSCAPLCRAHHNEYDAGRDAFEKKYEVDMQIEAKAHYALFKIVGGE